jgi:uncharacterized protein YjiK
MKKTIIALTLLCLAAAVSYMRFNHLDVLWWKNWNLNRQTMPEQALMLGNYRVDIDGLEVPGVNDDLSALTYNSDTNTLFALLNGDNRIIELSLEGLLLRSIRVPGADDMEGLTHVTGDRYVIAEERKRRLSLVTITDATQSVNIDSAPSLVIAFGESGNKGLEGLFWDDQGQRLLVVRERDPLRVMAVTGFVEAVAGEPIAINITEIKSADFPGLFMRDLSSLSMHAGSGHLLLLSDQSHMVVEYDLEGQPLSLLGLWKGMSGLRKTVKQAEGLAVDNRERIYVVSEPNLFYRFVPVD